ncbi:MAG: hypothetical protein WC043_03685 [Pseudobdellovibrionaceae bacterium]
MLKDAQYCYDEEGLLHREDGPAAILTNGTQKWYRHGKLHREDGPAKITPDMPQRGEYWGTQRWFQNGIMHREDGPACILRDGTKKWFHRGRLHREDGPAIEYPDGGKEHWENGQLHCEDGPAVDIPEMEVWIKQGKIHRDGDLPALTCRVTNSDTFYRYSIYSYFKRISAHSKSAFKPTPRAGDLQWWKEGVLTRENAPAWILNDGTSKWFKNGRLHREDGPAVEYPNGSREWWEKGKLHRENSPAIEVKEGFFLFSEFGIPSEELGNTYLERRGRVEAIELPNSMKNFTRSNLDNFDKNAKGVIRTSDGYRIKRITRERLKGKYSKNFLILCDIYDYFFPSYIHIESRGYYPYANKKNHITKQQFWRKGKLMRESWH